MNDVADGTEEIERSYRRRKWIGTVLASALIGASAWAAWAYLLRVPSPRTVCRSLHGLVEDHAEEDAAQRLVARVARRALQADDPKAAFAERCEAFFGAEQPNRLYGKATRCMTTSWSAEAALQCFDTHRFYADAGADALEDLLANAPVSFPEGAPELPGGLDDAYAQLVAVSIAALQQCDAIWDVEHGCYHYVGSEDANRERAQAIPSPVPGRESGLLLLEATCSFDAAKWVQRHPELRERLAAAPIPVERIACQYLPAGDLREAAECTAFKPAPGRASVGLPDRAGARVMVPYDPECADRVVRVEITREDDEGRRVELDAYFEGRAYRPPTDAPEDSEGGTE